MSNVKTTCLRFNLDKPIYCKAWEILQHSDKSHSKLIAEALAEYHDRHSRLADDPYFENREREDRFVEQIVSAVGTALEKTLPSFLTACLVNITQPYNITPTAVKASEAEPQTETSADEIDWERVPKSRSPSPIARIGGDVLYCRLKFGRLMAPE